jgi:hypothetical protein
LVDAIIAGVRLIKVQERVLDQGNNLSLAKTLDIGREYENAQKQLNSSADQNRMSQSSGYMSVTGNLHV